MGRGVKLIASDFAISFMWVWASVMAKMLIYKPLGITGDEAKHEVIKSGMSVFNMFVFAWFGKLTNGGAYNPLMVLSTAVSADFATFLFTLAARIPAQVVGSITGVKLVLEMFPEMGHATSLNVDIHKGAVTEGILTFVIVIISLGLTAKIPGSFLMKTWISSVSKVALHILGSDLTGGYMNPASVIGWAFARGDHITREHFLVYWLAPIEATLLAVLIFRLLVQPLKEEEARLKAKKSE